MPFQSFSTRAFARLAVAGFLATTLSAGLCHAEAPAAPAAKPLAAQAAPEVALADEAEALTHDMSFFTDGSCRELKPGVGAARLGEFKSALLKRVAGELLAGKYDKTYRAADYEAYPTPAELGRSLKIGRGFSHYENMTGIYLEAGEHAVFVGDTGGKTVALLVPDLMRQPTPGHKPTEDPAGWGLHKQQIALKPGLNLIRVKIAGNAYVDYFDDNAEKAPKIAVNFPTGKVNGYFDGTRQTDADWDRLLDNAVSPIMDARGKHIQVAYPVSWFKTYTRGKGVELIRNYDTMLHHHYTLLGLVKYDKVPKNRILSRVNFNYYMFRDGDGVAYLGDKGTMGMVADPARVISGDPCWGFCHEAGHVLQMPELKWNGMTEVSNNLFTLYTCGKMGNKSRLVAQKSYASARKSIIESDPKISYLADPDVFHRLVPFWQLHLYFTRHGHPDFYADVMEQMRLRPDSVKRGEAIRNQFEYIKTCCDVGKVDLTDFFEKWGFFVVGELSGNDYGAYRHVITPKMVDETKAYIAAKNYPKPKVDITTLED